MVQMEMAQMVMVGMVEMEMEMEHETFKDLYEDVRKMPDGAYGVYADKFKKGKRVMTPGGKHAKELKKVYKNEKDANDYMSCNHDTKGGGNMKQFKDLYNSLKATYIRKDKESKEFCERMRKKVRKYL